MVFPHRHSEYTQGRKDNASSVHPIKTGRSSQLGELSRDGAPQGLGLHGILPFERQTNTQNKIQVIPPSPTSSGSLSSSNFSEGSSLSNLRHHNSNYSNFDEDLWPALWLHPNIVEVTRDIIQEIPGAGFSYRSAWLLMHICDLQIVYRLSNSTAANRDSKSFLRVEVPDNALLPPSLIINCAEAISAQRVSHHIPPHSFMEREIQLRALVSCLSLLHLFPVLNTQPRLCGNSAENLRSNIVNLSVELHNGRGSEADKGDCEFMIRCALNLLSTLPSDETAGVKVVSNFANFLFAAGMAYQYNGPEAIKHLTRAFRRIVPKPSKWHAEFDQYHHLCMIVISWSLYCGDPNARRAFRQLCSDLIAQMRQKLRDYLAMVNEKRSSDATIFLERVVSRAADLVGNIEPLENPSHLTYGFMYLIGRLIERFLAEGGGIDKEEKESMDQLKKLLVGVVQRTKFEEIKFKAYEILFSGAVKTHGWSPTSLWLFGINDMNIKSNARETEKERRKREKNIEEYHFHLDIFTKRQRFIKNALAGLDVKPIRNAREGHEQTINFSSKEKHDTMILLPLPSREQEIRNSDDKNYSPTSHPGFHDYPKNYPVRRDSHNHWHSNPHEVIHTPDTPHGFLREVSEHNTTRITRGRQPNRSPGSPNHTDHRRQASIDSQSWKETPKSFAIDDYSLMEPDKEKFKGTPMCTCTSGNGESVAFLSKTGVDVYSLAASLTQSDGQGKMRLKSSHQFCSKDTKVSKTFVSAVLNNRYVAAITRDRLEIINFSENSTLQTCIETLYNPEVGRLCQVAISRLHEPQTLVALAFVNKDGKPRIHIYDIHQSESNLKALQKRTLEFGHCHDTFNEPSRLSFSDDDSHLTCTSSVRGDVLTWNLKRTRDSPSFCIEVPVNDGLGHGRAGVTSAALFPSNRYFLVTTGSSFSPAFINSRSRDIPTAAVPDPKAAVAAGTVSPNENAFALLTESGKIFVSKLEANGDLGYRAGRQLLLKDVRNFQTGCLKFVMAGHSQVLVAAFISRHNGKQETKVLQFKF